jgi:hypothetical protein
MEETFPALSLQYTSITPHPPRKIRPVPTQPTHLPQNINTTHILINIIPTIHPHML